MVSVSLHGVIELLVYIYTFLHSLEDYTVGLESGLQRMKPNSAAIFRIDILLARKLPRNLIDRVIVILDRRE